jgi:hypothetical protein
MNSWRISDYARSGDSHANCAMVGGFLMLTGIAIGLALAEGSKAIQGEIQEQLGGHNNPQPVPPPPTPDLNALIGQAIGGLLK